MNSERVNQILVVDDDAAFNKAVCVSLGDLAATRGATSADEALALMNREPFNLIITDFKMNGLTGLELVALTKRFVPTPPVIVMTAFADKKLAIDSLNQGVFALVEKPFEHDELRSHVSRALNPAGARSTFTLNPGTNAVSYEGETYILTKTEYEIVAIFISHPEKWITRESIERQIWEDSRSGSRNIFDTHLTNIKRKLPFIKDRLETVRGRGYFFRGESHGK